MNKENQESKELDLQQVIDSYLRKEREERDQRERKGWYASELGQCLQGVYRQRLEGPPEYDERRLRLFSVGNIFHHWLVEKIRHAGHEILAEERVESPEYHLSGRADLLIKGSERTTLYELKTMHSQGFWYRQKSGGLALPHHELQVTAYMWLLRERFPDLRARLWYISKDDLAVLSVPVAYREETVAAVKRELEILNEAWDSGEPPAAAETLAFDEIRGRWGVNWQAKYCPTHDQCTGDPEWLSKAEKQVKELNKKLGKKGGEDVPLGEMGQETQANSRQ